MDFRSLPELPSELSKRRPAYGLAATGRLLVIFALICALPLAGIVGIVPAAIASAESTEEQEDETLERLHRDHEVGEARQRTARQPQYQVPSHTNFPRPADASYSRLAATERGLNSVPQRLRLRC